MNAHTFQFLIYCAFNVLCLVGGYVARRRRWLPEDLSRTLHFYTIVITWSGVGMLSVWQLPQTTANLWLLLLEPLLVAVPAFVTIPIAKAMGAKREHVGLLAVGAGLGNLGFTLGAYLCYTFLTDPSLLPHPGGVAVTPGDTANAALAYAVAQLTVMVAMGIVLLYPVARYFGEHESNDEPLGALIFHSLVDVRAMSLYAAVLGAIFAYVHVPYPRQVVEKGHLFDVLFYLGGFGAYFGIGLRLHLGRSFQNMRLHGLLAVMKFAFIPLLTLGLVVLAGYAPVPLPKLAVHSMMLEAFMPTAIQMVIIANLFHLDARFASTLWLINTVLFLILALPLLIVFFH